MTSPGEGPAPTERGAGEAAASTGSGVQSTEPAAELVTCPSCGRSAWVQARRRNASDFCTNCDYPLFWAAGRVLRADGEADGSSIRRLPGTAGHVTVVTRPCPECAEQNPLGAVTCLRCGALMDPPPPPEPVPEPEPEPVVVVPEPVPEPEPEPEPDHTWVIPMVLSMLIIAFVVALALTSS